MGESLRKKITLIGCLASSLIGLIGVVGISGFGVYHGLKGNQETDVNIQESKSHVAQRLPRENNPSNKEYSDVFAGFDNLQNRMRIHAQKGNYKDADGGYRHESETPDGLGRCVLRDVEEGFEVYMEMKSNELARYIFDLNGDGRVDYFVEKDLREGEVRLVERATEGIEYFHWFDVDKVGERRADTKEMLSEAQQEYNTRPI